MRQLKTSVASEEKPLSAAAWMVGSILSFSAMAVAGRLVREELDTFELMTYRSLIGFVCVVVVAALAGTLREISPRHLRGHILRNVAHFTGQNLWFYALPLIPLAQVFALEFTSPLWVILLAPVFLGEKFDRRRVIAAFIGFAGILMVARPGIGGLSPGVTAAFLAALAFAVTNILTKRLTRHEPITAILFYLTLTQIVFGVACAGFDGYIAVPSTALLPALAVVGVAGISAHLCLTRALALASASVVAPMDFARLPFIAIVGYLLFDEVIHPLTIVGGAVILFANSMNLRSERGWKA